MMAADPERMTELSALLAARFAMVPVLVIAVYRAFPRLRPTEKPKEPVEPAAPADESAE